MGKSQDQKYGGFAAENAGLIIDCYARSTVKGNLQSAGFAAVNQGEIRNCYSAGKVKRHKRSGGFCASNQGSISHCYYDAKETGKVTLADGEQGLEKEKMSDPEFFKEQLWDFEQTWEMETAEGVCAPRLRAGRAAEEVADEGILIRSREELLAAAERIRGGQVEACKAKYQLTADIDLEGLKWEPLGTHLIPFEGSFDGGGHCIRNFTIRGKKAEFSGFFGYLQNAEISNLGIDCVVTGGKVTGALAGMNANGTISQCHALSRIRGRAAAGGLVGKNTGTIRECYAAGEVSSALLCIPFGGSALLFGKWGALAALLLLTAAGVTLGVYLGDQSRQASGDPVITYPPVPLDPNADPDPEDDKQPSQDGNSVSFEFDKTVNVSQKDWKASFYFKNPGDSNHNVVVQLQMSDSELIKAIGSTGRMPQEQEALENQQGYDSESSRMILAESGSVPPKYALDKLEIAPLPNGETLPKGTWNAVVYLLFYDMNTNEKAMLNTQVPVKLVVK